DSVRGPLLVDEGHHHFGRRSSSACAKYADALRKISLARFSSSTSRSNAFTRCRSSVVAPGRVPPSRSAWRTHRRNASAVQPSLPAIDRIAAHCDAWTSACSKTIRTACSRNSGAYRVPVDIGSILSRKEPSDKPGAIQTCLANQDFAELHSLVLDLLEVPDIMVSTMLNPEVDFDGNVLQTLAPDAPVEWVSFSLIGTDTGGAAVFAWLGNGNEVARRLIDSLER